MAMSLAEVSMALSGPSMIIVTGTATRVRVGWGIYPY